MPVVIPPEIQKSIADFERYYQSKHTGRKLSWKHALAHCQLRAIFPRGQKEIVVSSFQAIVLLLFNNVGQQEHLGYERIKAESGLSEVEVKRTLQSLACAKLNRYQGMLVYILACGLPYVCELRGHVNVQEQ